MDQKQLQTYIDQIKSLRGIEQASHDAILESAIKLYIANQYIEFADYVTDRGNALKLGIPSIGSNIGDAIREVGNKGYR